MAAAALAANLPDPRQPTIILFLAGFGALMGTAVGRIRHLPRERTREIAEDPTFAGGLIGSVVYLAAVAEIFGGTLRGQVAGVILIIVIVHWVLRTRCR